MQSKNKNVRIQLPERYRRYCEFKRHLTERSSREVFPIEGSNTKNLRQIVGGGQGNRVYSTDGISTTIASQAGGQGAKTGLYAVTRGRSTDEYKKSETSPTLRGGDKDDIKIVSKNGKEKKKNHASTLTGGGHSGGKHSDMDLLVETIKIPSATKCGYERARNGDSIRLSHIGSKTGRGRVGKQKSQTLTAGGDMYTLKDTRIRRLTPTECERLQGFPDNWTKYGVEIPVHKKPCAKVQISAIVGKNIGTNECENPQLTCPREPGEDYKKCKTICRQGSHAEIDCLKIKPTTNKMYLYGHDHCCDNCLAEMEKNGITDVVFSLPRIKISDSQRYKMLGNAVTVPVIKAIIKKLI